MSRNAWRIALLLFASGTCALVYQVAWQREFRLVFGASTAASAAVLAVFIGGLGLGALLLGGRSDRHPRPLAFYAQLETGIALSAALSPGLLWVVRQAYVQTGGSVALGSAPATVLRLALAAVVLAIPTLLMGGTLPAAARAAETDEDQGRRSTGLLYGCNTLGAVVGALVTTFFMLEVFGTRSTVWLAALVNLLVAMAARNLARTLPVAEAASSASGPDRAGGAVELADAVSVPPLTGASTPVQASGDGRRPGVPDTLAAPAWFVLVAAAVVGFAFFLMELVWYRMLGPLLGGTVFTFGLILAVALLGIGIGGAGYAVFGTNRPAHLSSFAHTCLLEALCIALAFALGDRLAILALLLRPLGAVGFSGLVAGWAVVTSLVVLPAAIFAGFQFPLLIALLGSGRRAVGRQIGLAYAANTLGAIAGSLAGGFGLLPVLTAPGCWRAVASLLAVLGMVAVLVSLRVERKRRRILVPVGMTVVVAVLLMAEGPTAFWRHSPIGVGRVPQEATASRADLRAFPRFVRRVIEWEAEGLESSVALDNRSALSFVLNGKSDGNALIDAPTQVMSGVLGALLHPGARRAMVIGLGTGSTAGWLGAVAEIDQVDVVELEPAMLEVAQAFAPVNHGAMTNQRVHVHVGDAREVLLTTPTRYDIIFSEPSNPYRAGIASLFTQEYYRAIDNRLTPDGLFIQWVQAYEVDAGLVRTAIATLASVFPSVETWQTCESDILFIASRRPIRLDVAAMRARIRTEPFRRALADVWLTNELEGVLARFVAGPGLARIIAEEEAGRLNTDDRNYLEFSFAHTAGRRQAFSIQQIRDAAVGIGGERPDAVNGRVDWARVEEVRVSTIAGTVPTDQGLLSLEARQRLRAHEAYRAGDLHLALAAWQSQRGSPSSPLEQLLVAEALAAGGREDTLSFLGPLGPLGASNAAMVLARLRFREGRLDEAASALVAAFAGLGENPWSFPELGRRSVALARELARQRPELAPQLLESLMQPFAVRAMNETRINAVLDIASQLDLKKYCQRVLEPLEPHVPWELAVLAYRQDCYAALDHPRRAVAFEELDELIRSEPSRFALAARGR